MVLYVSYHFEPVVVSFDQGISFPNAKMPEVVMHLPENTFYQGFRDNCSFVFLAILPVYVVQQTIIIPIRIPFLKPTPRIFHQFGNPDAMLVRLLQTFLLVMSTSHRGQQSSPTSTFVTFRETSSSFRELSFLSLVVKGSWDKQSAASFFYSCDQVCVSLEYSYHEAPRTTCPV